MKTENEIRAEYVRWLKNAEHDPDLRPELEALDEKGIEDAFYRDISFGTGGLRGVIGAGTNRINVYTVARASAGLASYLKEHFEAPSVVIGYDSRIKSELFARVAAGVFAQCGVRVRIWDRLMPVSTVSFGVRALGASAGVMITASHNPCKYNGYKVYGPDGCQITTDAAEEIFSFIQGTDFFEDIRFGDFQVAMERGDITYIPDSVYTDFTECVKAQSVLYGDDIDRNASIVYSPLNGTGLLPVLRVLRESGYRNITVVREQESPDGNFPTCPYPNPEIKEALALGIEYAKRTDADIMLATDPDCDRVGIAVRQGDGYSLLSGNEVGMLLLDYICSQRIKHGKIPEAPVAVKTVVTVDMASRIAAKYGVRTVEVLTGFKFIGEQIGLLEKSGRADSFIFGFEESYGYLSGSYVRDKDGVFGAFMICEMLGYYKARGVSLTEKLSELYSEFGYCLNTLHSFAFEGSEGFVQMKGIMERLRRGICKIGERRVESVQDYILGLGGLPSSDVLKFLLDGNCSVTVRPSGTEPKLKIYISVSAPDVRAAKEQEAEIINDLRLYFG